MNLHNGPDKNNNNRTAKATAAIPMVGILAAAALLLGLLSVIGSETAIAQQNMTGTNATNATAMNATGNQTAAGNQTGTVATTGGNNTAGTTGGGGTTGGTEGGGGGGQLEGIFGRG